jgi:hypothetical protein
MISTSLPAAGLPRSRCLTDALLAPCDRAPTAAALEVLRARLRDGIGAAASGPPLRIDGYRLRTAGRGAGTSLPAPDRPFAWSPRTARRSVAIAAVRHGLEVGRSPAASVAETVARMVDEGRAGRGRRGSPAAWLATLGDGARAQVLAEATTWATHLYEALEWGRLGRSAVVGGADRWWDCPTARVALRGRADVRVERPSSGPALLTVNPGRPGPTSRVELALAALVDVVSRPACPPPSRVVGWWPECGRALVLAVDLPLLAESARSVVTAVLLTGKPDPRSDAGEREHLGVAA